jgi:hypothetical protein
MFWLHKTKIIFNNHRANDALVALYWFCILHFTLLPFSRRKQLLGHNVQVPSLQWVLVLFFFLWRCFNYIKFLWNRSWKLLIVLQCINFFFLYTTFSSDEYNFLTTTTDRKQLEYSLVFLLVLIFVGLYINQKWVDKQKIYPNKRKSTDI